ncbi:MAG: HAMP domain-containing histidine kinase [Calditrichaceae bacterium]|nr:HAMP domain-containing histidine kinase [Calditrichaceae bacterium]MBN2709763.1 HAMP domain-containing histidine kinase [Calditrichaceae bacterium]RQV94957.1 MAG: sensor histidine kinase [Calditrichota bacterium]
MYLSKPNILLFSAGPSPEKRILNVFNNAQFQLETVHSKEACLEALENGQFDLFIFFAQKSVPHLTDFLNNIHSYSPTMLTCCLGPFESSKNISMDFNLDYKVIKEGKYFDQYMRNMAFLAHKIQTQSDLSAILIHDLRSPTQSIINYLELLNNQVFGEMNEGQLRMIGNALKLGENLIHLLEELSLVHVFERKEFVLYKSPLNLKECLNRVLKSLWIQADKKEIKFVPQIPNVLPEITADGPRLERVLFNLITNAINYTPQRGVIRIIAETGESAKHESGIIFRVIDSGPGIPEEELEYIFDKYYRVLGKVRKHKGFGLGLYICRLIVEAHDGRIGAVNNREGGSTFYFSLPV